MSKAQAGVGSRARVPCINAASAERSLSAGWLSAAVRRAPARLGLLLDDIA